MANSCLYIIFFCVVYFLWTRRQAETGVCCFREWRVRTVRASILPVTLSSSHPAKMVDGQRHLVGGGHDGCRQLLNIGNSVSFWSRNLIFGSFERELTLESAEHIERRISIFPRGNEIVQIDTVQRIVTSQITGHQSTLRGVVRRPRYNIRPVLLYTNESRDIYFNLDIGRLICRTP